jgi:beta-glucanase (GH16 family)
MGTMTTKRVYTFRDDFNGPAGTPPDPAKWVHQTGRWPDNNELETYTDSIVNSYQDGQGHLVINAMQGDGEITSARLTSRFSQAYGGFEARIMVNAQRSLWPAFWLMGANYSSLGWPACGEIDVMENYGWAEVAETTVHIPDGQGGVVAPVKGTTYADVDLKPGWHTYRMWWTPSVIRFHLDNTQYLEVLPQYPHWPYSEGVPMFMILNLAVGGTGGGPVPATFSSAAMLVDYVHVWK